jgi:hypothetical protein
LVAAAVVVKAGITGLVEVEQVDILLTQLHNTLSQQIITLLLEQVELGQQMEIHLFFLQLMLLQLEVDLEGQLVKLLDLMVILVVLVVAVVMDRQVKLDRVEQEQLDRVLLVVFLVATVEIFGQAVAVVELVLLAKMPQIMELLETVGWG